MKWNVVIIRLTCFLLALTYMPEVSLLAFDTSKPVLSHVCDESNDDKGQEPCKKKVEKELDQNDLFLHAEINSKYTNNWLHHGPDAFIHNKLLNLSADVFTPPPEIV